MNFYVIRVGGQMENKNKKEFKIIKFHILFDI